MKVFAIIVAVLAALTALFGIISLLQGHEVDTAAGMTAMSLAPITSLLLCFVVILLADIRKALTQKTDAKDNEVNLSLTN
jgi:hypothetical protein